MTGLPAYHRDSGVREKERQESTNSRRVLKIVLFLRRKESSRGDGGRLLWQGDTESGPYLDRKRKGDR